MTRKKAQGMGFIIVMVISIFAIIGIVVGTVNVWTSLACTLGAPLRTSFAPHVGNIKASTVFIEITDESDIDYDVCWSECTTGALLPPQECFNFCSEICPENQKCKAWDLAVTYNGRPAEDGTMIVELFNKPFIGGYDYTEYGMSIDEKEFKNIQKGVQEYTVLSAAYIDVGETVGSTVGITMPFYFNCGTGDFIKIEATADDKTAKLEDDQNKDFCVVPKIIVNYTKAGSTKYFDVTTNTKCNCHLGTAALNVQPATLNQMDSSNGLNHNYTFTGGGVNFYVICAKQIQILNELGEVEIETSSSAEVWVTKP